MSEALSDCGHPEDFLVREGECLACIYGELREERDRLAALLRDFKTRWNMLDMEEAVTLIDAALAGQSGQPDRLASRVQVLEEALRPFARDACPIYRGGDDSCGCSYCNARKVLAAQPDRRLHYFVNDPDDVPHHETCKQCGLNIRDLVHIRVDQPDRRQDMGSRADNIKDQEPPHIRGA